MPVAVEIPYSPASFPHCSVYVPTLDVLTFPVAFFTPVFILPSVHFVISNHKSTQPFIVSLTAVVHFFASHPHTKLLAKSTMFPKAPTSLAASGCFSAHAWYDVDTSLHLLTAFCPNCELSHSHSISLELVLSLSGDAVLTAPVNAFPIISAHSHATTPAHLSHTLAVSSHRLPVLVCGLIVLNWSNLFHTSEALLPINPCWSLLLFILPSARSNKSLPPVLIAQNTLEVISFAHCTILPTNHCFSFAINCSSH